MKGFLQGKGGSTPASLLVSLIRPGNDFRKSWQEKKTTGWDRCISIGVIITVLVIVSVSVIATVSFIASVRVIVTVILFVSVSVIVTVIVVD
jgi:hypothetical protein